MELRTSDDRPILITDGRPVPPTSLPLPTDLDTDLHEWARVAHTLTGTDPTDTPAAAVVSRRGHQLATRLADALNTPITYVDPLSAEATVITPTTTAVAVDTEDPQPPTPPAEPTPWATGLLVAAFAFTLVVFAIGTLASTLNENSALLAIGANVVVTGGLLPSVWLARTVPVWRWVALGVAAGIAAGWIALPFIIFS